MCEDLCISPTGDLVCCCSESPNLYLKRSFQCKIRLVLDLLHEENDVLLLSSYISWSHDLLYTVNQVSVKGPRTQYIWLCLQALVEQGDPLSAISCILVVSRLLLMGVWDLDLLCFMRYFLLLSIKLWGVYRPNENEHRKGMGW